MSGSDRQNFDGVILENRRVPRRPGPPQRQDQLRLSASSIVESALRQAIIAMQMRPGDALVEKEIAARFGLSRTPVREAMLRLRNDDLVEIFPQSGTFVARIPIGKIHEAVIIRQALEAMAAEQAASRADGAAFERLRQIIADQIRAAAAGDAGHFHEADEAFHAAISEASGFPGIWHLAQSVKAQVDRCRRLTLPVPGRMQKVIEEHQRILEAMMAGDGAKARAALGAHLEAVLPDLTELQRLNPEYFI
jgi:GntR family transcriptional regulator, rspAB operon transcriptional repressor